jgi:hypothetical protein
MEKGSGCKGKGDGEVEGMYREGGWRRGGCKGKGDGRGSCIMFVVSSLHGGVIIAHGCSHHVWVHSSCGGALVKWGWNHRTGVESSCEGVLVVWGCTGRTGVELSCEGDVAIVAPVRLVAPR